jgi:hypothetical protein
LRGDCFPDTVVRVWIPSLFSFRLWGVSDAIREGPTIVTNCASTIFAFANTDHLLATNAGRFETVAASGIE